MSEDSTTGSLGEGTTLRISVDADRANRILESLDLPVPDAGDLSAIHLTVRDTAMGRTADRDLVGLIYQIQETVVQYFQEKGALPEVSVDGKIVNQK